MKTRSACWCLGRMLLPTLTVAGCDTPKPTQPTATVVNAPTAPSSKEEPAPRDVPAPQVASPAENVASQPVQEASQGATFGSPLAKAHPEQAKAMLAAAEKAWEANRASYEVGTTTLSNVHLWSRQLLLAERAVADTKEKDLAALLAYWKRTKSVYLKVRALYNTGTRGGETERFAEASFYLAEAELWLLDGGGTIPDEND